MGINFDMRRLYRIKKVTVTSAKRDCHLMIIYTESAPHPSLHLFSSFPRIIKRLAQLRRDEARLAVAHARAVKLHEAKPEDGSKIFQQHTFARGVPQVA